MKAPRLATVAATVLLAAACNGSDQAPTGSAESATPTEPIIAPATATAGPSASPTPTPTPTPTPAPTTAEIDLPDPDLNDKEAAGFPDPSGPTAYLDSVEIGDHESYERVVFTFTPDSPIPSWAVAYTDEITESGSGRPVDIAGDAFLSVTMSGASGVDMTGQDFVEVYTGPERIAGSESGASVVQEVVEAGDFEAVMDWGIGLTGERPFRVFTLQDPSRLVVDITTD